MCLLSRCRLLGACVDVEFLPDAEGVRTLFGVLVAYEDTDQDQVPDFDYSGYVRKVQRETTWIRTTLNETLQRSGWPTLTRQEIDGILGANAKRGLRIG